MNDRDRGIAGCRYSGNTCREPCAERHTRSAKTIMSRGQRSLFPLTGIPKQCEAAQCRELAAPADILCPPHRTCHRNGLLGICISCRKWMDDPEHWGYNCADCARRHNPTVNSR